MQQDLQHQSQDEKYHGLKRQTKTIYNVKWVQLSRNYFYC